MHISYGVIFSYNAFTSVAVPYSSVPHTYNVLYPLNLEYLAKVSALNTHPIIFPKWGTLLTYGNALVINTFLLSFYGNIYYPKFVLTIF